MKSNYVYNKSAYFKKNNFFHVSPSILLQVCISFYYYINIFKQFFYLVYFLRFNTILFFKK